jgi:exosortase K
MKLRLATIAAAAAIAWGLKRHYADARVEDLEWILGPTSRLAGLMAATRFVPRPGEGYFAPDHLFLIAKACAGINFMLAAFTMVTLALMHRVRSLTSAMAALTASIVASYGAAVLVNATRIVVALWLAAHPVSILGADAVHRLEGIVVYFGGLVLLYEIVRRADEGGERRCRHRLALPLGCYYVVTLAIPIANGASLSSAFVGHALVVLTVPVLLIATASAAGDLRRN